MNLMVFVSDDGSPEGTGRIVIVPARTDAALPRNPRSFEWRYFATVTEGDFILNASQHAECLRSIADEGHYIASRLIYAQAKPHQKRP